VDYQLRAERNRSFGGRITASGKNFHPFKPTDREAAAIRMKTATLDSGEF
jgi:hypothetical protein